MIKLGITGGIGSGKSVVSEFLQVLGFPVYNSDERAKFLMTNHADVRKSLISLLGQEVFVGSYLNKAYLSAKIFSDVQLLEEINNIVHPAVWADFDSFCNREKGCELVGLESAILVESGGDKLVDNVLLVSTPVEQRIERVIKRSGLSREQIEARIGNQKKESELKALADFVVINDEKNSLILQLIDILQKIGVI